MNDFDLELSERGVRRREEILRLAHRESLSRKRRRVAVRGVMVCVMGGTLILSLLRNLPQSTRDQIVDSSKVVPVDMIIEHIQTDPTIVDRLAVHGQPPQWSVIGDEELLQVLADAGQPAGIIHIGNEAVLLPWEEPEETEEPVEN